MSMLDFIEALVTWIAEERGRVCGSQDRSQLTGDALRLHPSRAVIVKGINMWQIVGIGATPTSHTICHGQCQGSPMMGQGCQLVNSQYRKNAPI